MGRQSLGRGHSSPPEEEQSEEIISRIPSRPSISDRFNFPHPSELEDDDTIAEAERDEIEAASREWEAARKTIKTKKNKPHSSEYPNFGVWNLRHRYWSLIMGDRLIGTEEEATSFLNQMHTAWNNGTFCLAEHRPDCLRIGLSDPGYHPDVECCQPLLSKSQRPSKSKAILIKASDPKNYGLWNQANGFWVFDSSHRQEGLRFSQEYAETMLEENRKRFPAEPDRWVVAKHQATCTKLCGTRKQCCQPSLEQQADSIASFEGNVVDYGTEALPTTQSEWDEFIESVHAKNPKRTSQSSVDTTLNGQVDALSLFKQLGGTPSSSTELANYRPAAVKKTKAKVVQPEEYKVKVIPPRQVPYAPGTIAAKAFSILIRHQRPLHISELIQKLTSERAFHTTHHRYSETIRMLRQHFPLFEKVGKGLYTVRVGFRKTQKPEAIQVAIPAPNNRPNNQQVTSLSDLVVKTSRECSTPMGVYPGLIFRLLQQMKIKAGLNAIIRVMQTDKFKKKGDWYKLKEAQ